MPLISIFLILLVMVFAVVAYFTEPDEAARRTRERLGGLDRRSLTQDQDEGIMRQVTFSSNPALDEFLRGTSAGPRLLLLLEQARVSWTVGRFLFITAAAIALGAVVGNLWLRTGWMGWIPALAMGAMPLLWVLYKRSVRFRRFNLQLPEAIDLIARALRAGHALPSALVTVADEMADPLGPEFRRAADELNFGLPFREAMLNLMRRFPIPDVTFLVAAILLQKETGGNLAELLDKTAAVLRSRIQLQQKVRVYTAQGRMTGAILTAMPFICFFVLNFIKPGYGDPLFNSDFGRKMLWVTLFNMVLGFLVIRRIVNVKY